MEGFAHHPSLRFLQPQSRLFVTGVAILSVEDLWKNEECRRGRSLCAIWGRVERVLCILRLTNEPRERRWIFSPHTIAVRNRAVHTQSASTGSREKRGQTGRSRVSGDDERQKSGDRRDVPEFLATTKIR